jgi:hypothetical protein
VTDVDGRAEVVLTPDRANYDRRLTLEVEVVDASNRSVAAAAAQSLAAGCSRCACGRARGSCARAMRLPLEVITTDHKGVPVSAAVTVDLDQQAWNPLTHRYTRRCARSPPRP